jgi:hypothetical protein
MDFHSMQNITAGIASNVDFNMTSACIVNGLDRELKHNCSKIHGMTPLNAGMIQFLQVDTYYNLIENHVYVFFL